MSMRLSSCTVLDAVNKSWNNECESAIELLKPMYKSDARYALEYSFVHVVQSAINGATSDANKRISNMLVHAEELAYKLSEGKVSARRVDPLYAASDTESDDLTEETLDHDHVDVDIKHEPSVWGYFKSVFGADLPEDPELLCRKVEGDTIAADALLMRSIMQLQANQYVAGAVNIRKTWHRYKALVRILEKRSNDIPKHLADIIRCGVGVFYIFLSLAPPALQKVLSAIGFVADRKQGEAYLQQTFRSGGVRSANAALVLLTLYLFCPTKLGHAEDTLAKAKVILTKMNAKYPNNSYFFGYANFYHRKTGAGAPAVESINKALQCFPSVPQSPMLLRYLKADTYFMNMQWAEAAAQYTALWQELSKKGSESFDYTGQVVLTLGAAHAALGDMPTATKYMRLVKQATNTKSKQDASSPPFALLCGTDARYLKMAALFCLNLNKDLEHLQASALQTLLIKLEKDNASGSLTRGGKGVAAMYHLFTGMCQHGCGDKAAARLSWLAVLKQEKHMSDDPCGTLAYAYALLGDLSYTEGKPSLAKNYFEKGSKLKKSAMPEALSTRFANALEDLQ